MTLEQLRIFIEVAEREHLTRASEALHLTPSAVSSAIRTMEDRYGATLFNRIGRRIELTGDGRMFLDEARATLARARSAERMLSELGGGKRGILAIHASQTIASYWLPSFLARFHSEFPLIDVRLTLGNTESVTQATEEGVADIGLVEGAVQAPSLSITKVASDQLILVARPDHDWAAGGKLTWDRLFEGNGYCESRDRERAAFSRMPCALPDTIRRGCMWRWNCPRTRPSVRRCAPAIL